MMMEDLKKMGRLRFELRTNRLKAECSTAELATLLSKRNKVPRQVVPSGTHEKYHPGDPSSKWVHTETVHADV